MIIPLRRCVWKFTWTPFEFQYLCFNLAVSYFYLQMKLISWTLQPSLRIGWFSKQKELHRSVINDM